MGLFVFLRGKFHVYVRSLRGRQVTFGPNGAEKVHPIGELNDYEKGRLAEARFGATAPRGRPEAAELHSSGEHAVRSVASCHIS